MKECQENFPGLKDMNFQIDRTYQVPNTMHEDRPVLRYIIVNFQYIGGKKRLKVSQKEGKKSEHKSFAKQKEFRLLYSNWKLEVNKAMPSILYPYYQYVWAKNEEILDLQKWKHFILFLHPREAHKRRAPPKWGNKP